MNHTLDKVIEDRTIYLTITVDAITPETLENFSSYLAENVHELLDAAADSKMKEAYWFYAIRVVLGDKYTVPERAMWSLIVRCLSDPERHIGEYIDALCMLTRKEDTPESVDKYGPSELIWSSDEYPLGSYPFIEYFDWQYEESERFERSPVGEILDPFLMFLDHCDLDHETWQDEYISRILGKWHYAEAETEIDRLLTLLHFRLFNGQSIIFAREKDRNYLHRFLCYKCGLKKVVDRILKDEALEEVFSFEESLYLKLCACVYGTDMTLTDAVMDYVRGALDDDLIPMSEYAVEEIDEIREEADAFLKSQYTGYQMYADKSDSPYRPKDLDSGFHRYVLADQAWYPTDG